MSELRGTAQPDGEGGDKQVARTRGDGNVTIQISGDSSSVSVGNAAQALNDGPASFDHADGEAAWPIDKLPTEHGEFVGREHELATIREALTSGGVAITAIEGMGGIGKTAIGTEALRGLLKEGAFPDGLAFVNLQGFSETRDPLSTNEALEELLRPLVSEEEKLPDDKAARIQRWKRETASRSMLVFLDNARNEQQLEPLLPAGGRCRVLATSRNRLDLDGIRPITLGVMPPDEAKELALTNGNRWRPGRFSDEQAARLAELAGYLPLTIKVVAAALGKRPVLNADAELDKLADETRDALGMEQVKAQIHVSIRLLEKEQPNLALAWQRLSVFEGDFDLKAAAAVIAMDEAEHHVAELEQRHLVILNDDNRLQLHDILRAIALESIDPGEREGAGERHSRHYKGVLAAADDLYLEGRVLDGLQLYDREQPQIQAGQAFAAARIENTDALARLAADYANAGVYVVSLRASPRDWIAWLEIQAEASRKLGDRGREGSALGNLGIAYAALGDPRRAIEYYEQRLAIARELGDRRGAGNALGNLGNAYNDLGEPRRAIEYYEQVLVMAREIDHRRSEGNALGMLGLAYAALGNPRRAIEHHEQALVISRELGDRLGEARDLFNAAVACNSLGERAKAIDGFQQALAIEEAIKDPTVDETRNLLAKWTAEEDSDT